MQAGIGLHFRLVPLRDDLDLALFVVDDCSQPVASCLGSMDGGLGGEMEELHVRTRMAGDLFVVVDSFAARAGGPFRLSVGLK